ncbi:MAG: DUF992 domain-containing protein [Bosea sp. (in: a-proteobacteria)]|uniref:DUF992 domain-containing protein n=1 Tax=Bosea sp. (in: a-proteobacteria) TaxID=1871050 RepID=UPI0027356CD9|nr:DUF992 domain-containing protein [Bosea sp. (in: a-proteobacteria)]MDP3256268.1 DUF992 domain-containing protein [Bosea sp. (in: a-proteobacteria)]MDP3317949.1 DUF992 domain-containing protein [Bosea sp. (in: a-proteobacteria)]
MITRFSKPAFTAVVAAAGLLVSGLSASAQSGAPAGRLSCNVGAGLGLVVTSQRPMNCTFTPRRGPPQRYVGIVRNFGIDLGRTRATTMSWRVYGPYARAPLGALSGRYGGATAGASAGVGGSANLLVGGSDNAVTLQPLSLQGSRGVNVALGVTGFELSLVPPGRRR